MDTEEKTVETPEEQELEVSEGEESVEEGTEAPTDEEGQAEEPFDPDSFVDNLELPEAQKKVLKESLMRQGDYTRKTQELAQQRKLVEQWSPVLNKLVSDKKLFDMVMGYGDESQQQPVEDEIPQDPREYAEYVKRQTIAEMQQTMAIERDLEQASTLDPRLQSQDPQDVNFQRIVAGLVAQDSELLSGRKSYTQAVQDALQWYDGEFYKGVEKGVQTNLNRKVQDKRFVSPKGSSPISTKATDGPVSIMDAYKQTLTELGMSE